MYGIYINKLMMHKYSTIIICRANLRKYCHIYGLLPLEKVKDSNIESLKMLYSHLRVHYRVEG